MSLLRGQRGGMARGGLARGGLVVSGSSLDPDAAAYIAAVETAKGSAVSATQRDAIDSFIAGEKAASRWDSIKRLYLPIWGVAAANAICMRSLASGTFTVSGVTHAAGYVQGDGASGFFDTNVSPNALGITVASGFLVALTYEAHVGTLAHGYITAISTGTVQGVSLLDGGGSNSFVYGSIGSPSISGSDGSNDGILTVSRTGTNTVEIRKRTSSGAASIASGTSSADGITTQTLVAMARNVGGTKSLFSSGKLGSFGAGMGLSNTATDSFTLALKTLWETCTGLSLP